MLSKTKSRLATNKAGYCGKRLLFLSVLFSLVCFCVSASARIVIVELDEDDAYFAKPMRIVLSPGDSLMFKTINGDFSLYIEEAGYFLEIEDFDLKVEVNSSKPESPIYIVRKVDESVDQTYSIFCITNRSWPDAPPRIIIVVQ